MVATHSTHRLNLLPVSVVAVDKNNDNEGGRDDDDDVSVPQDTRNYRPPSTSTRNASIAILFVNPSGTAHGPSSFGKPGVCGVVVSFGYCYHWVCGGLLVVALGVGGGCTPSSKRWNCRFMVR